MAAAVPSRSTATSRSRARLRLAGAAVGVLAATALAGCTPTSTSSTTKTSNQKVSSSGTVVVVTAADDVCWTATVDGRKHKGCGDATFTDSAGGKGATVVKTRGGSRVGVRLVVGGKTVDRGSVWRSNRAATVDASS